MLSNYVVSWTNWPTGQCQTKSQILFYKKMLTAGLYYKDFGYHWHFFVEAEAAVEVVSRE